MDWLAQMLGIVTDPLFMAGAFFCLALLHRYFLDRKERLAVLLIFLIVVSASAGLAAGLLKDHLQVPRICAGEPGCPQDYALPSGHATVSFAFFSFLLFLNGRWRSSELYLAFPFLISLARVVQGVHTVSDILSGALLGCLIGLAFARIHIFTHKFEESSFRRKSAHVRT